MPYIGETAALAGAFFWGICAIMFEIAGKRIGTYNTNLVRLVMACVLLCITLFATKGMFFPIHANMQNIFWLGLSGFVGLVLGDGALFKSLVILGSHRTTLILSLAPPITTVIAWIFLGETLGLIALIGITVTIWGIFWVVSEHKDGEEKIHGSKLKGIIFGLIGATGQAVGLVLAKYGLQNDIDPLSATILRMVPSALILMIMGISAGRTRKILLAIRDNKGMLAAFGGAVFGPYLGVWLSVVAIKYTKTGIASTLMATVPIVIIPMLYFVYKEKPTLRAFIGTVITVAGIALLFLR